MEVSISHTPKKNKIEQIYFQRMKYNCFTGIVNSDFVSFFLIEKQYIVEF